MAWLGGFLSEVAVRCQWELLSLKGSKVAVLLGWQAGAWQEAIALLRRDLSCRSVFMPQRLASPSPRTPGGQGRFCKTFLTSWGSHISKGVMWSHYILRDRCDCGCEEGQRKSRGRALFDGLLCASCVSPTVPCSCPSWLVSWVLLPSLYRQGA